MDDLLGLGPEGPSGLAKLSHNEAMERLEASPFDVGEALLR
jgi:hypothetical protein